MAGLHRSSSNGTGLAVLLLASAVFAQPISVEERLRRCAATEPELARLICFEALARELDDEGAVPRDRTRPGPADALADAREAGDVDAFGAELLGEGDARGSDEIRSRLLGEFTGWRGNTVFRLENGQVWQQADNDRLVYASQSPIVTISRGALGTYRLTIDGLNSSCRVRRIE